MIKRLFSSSFKNKIRAFFLKGANVKCITCSAELSTFLPSGIPLRPNAVCPNCESLERTRIYWWYLRKDHAFFETTKKVLHTAPEKALFKLFSKNKNIDYSPIDKFEKGYDYPKGTMNMNILDLKFPDNYFDLILSSHVLEHIEDDKKAMKELYRVLSPDGFAIIQVPIDATRDNTYEDFTIVDPKMREKEFGQFDHVRVYGLDYKKRLESAGFTVHIDESSVQMSQEDRFRYGFAEGEPLYIVRK